jgi:hypothetical protein
MCQRGACTRFRGSALNRPDRTVDEQLQLAWHRILDSYADNQQEETADDTKEALEAMKPPRLAAW